MARVDEPYNGSDYNQGVLTQASSDSLILYLAGQSCAILWQTHWILTAKVHNKKENWGQKEESYISVSYT